MYAGWMIGRRHEAGPWAAALLAAWPLVAPGCGGDPEAPTVTAPQPRADRPLPARGLGTPEERDALARFSRVWATHNPVFHNTFLGVQTLQNPLDAWIVMEIIAEVAPDLIVEAGTHKGGSALVWAMLLAHVNPEGRVLTIDVEDLRDPRSVDHPLAERVDFLLGSSTDPDVVAEVRRRARDKRVLVLLDSLHTKEHVAAELEAYAPLVPVGSYVIVQDTLMGPVVAIEEFLAAHEGWSADRRRERFRLTNTVKGYLRRVR